MKIPETETQRLLVSHLRNDFKELRAKFPEYDTLSPQIQDVLLDMQYNMGAKFSEEKWPDLFATIKKRD